MMKFTVAIFAGLFFLALAVANAEETASKAPDAKKSETKKESPKTSKTETKAKSKTSKAEPKAEIKELKIEDVVVGKGKVASKGKTIKVNYTGWLYDPKAPKHHGKQFDTSMGKEPFTFTVGAGSVIKGWDEGFDKMKVGGKRILIIPSDMGYGARGAGDVIPPNAPLVFEVELLDVVD